MRNEEQRILESILNELRKAEDNRSNLYFNTKNCIDELKKKCELLHRNTDNSIFKSVENYNLRYKETLHTIKQMQTSINNIFSFTLIGFVILVLIMFYK